MTDHPPSLQHRSGGLRFYGFSFALIMLALWLAAKVILFQNLEYTSDLFSFLQMSRVSLEKGLLFTNEWGRMSAIHNFYAIVLFAPFTYGFGAYGLFVGSALLYAVASWRLLSLPEARFTRSGAITVLLVLFGPTGFWLFDDPVYGWNLELNFVPLSVLLAVALLQGSVPWIAATSILISLTKEDGPVLACMIYLAHELLVRRHLGAPPNSPAATALGMAKLCALWLAVFSLGLLLIHFQKTYGAVGGQADYGGRLALAASRFAQASSRSQGLYELAAMYVSTLAVIAATLIVLPSQRIRAAAVFSTLSMPIYLALAVPSFAYAGVYHGLLWPPRFALLWSLALAITIFTLSRQANAATNHRRLTYWLTMAVSLVLQTMALNYYRSYWLPERLAQPLALGDREKLASSRLHRDEIDFVDCLADGLQPASSVLTEGSLFAAFHRHDIVFPARIQQAWTAPVLAVCDAEQRLPFHDNCLNFVSAQASNPLWLKGQKGSIVALAGNPMAKRNLTACIKAATIP